MDERVIKAFERAADALERIANVIEKDTSFEKTANALAIIAKTMDKEATPIIAESPVCSTCGTTHKVISCPQYYAGR